MWQEKKKFVLITGYVTHLGVISTSCAVVAVRGGFNCDYIL